MSKFHFFSYCSPKNDRSVEINTFFVAGLKKYNLWQYYNIFLVSNWSVKKKKEKRMTETYPYLKGERKYYIPIWFLDFITEIFLSGIFWTYILSLYILQPRRCSVIVIDRFLFWNLTAIVQHIYYLNKLNRMNTEIT